MNMRLGDIVYADLAGVRGQADHFSAESIHSDGCGRRVNDDRDAGWDGDFKVHASLFRGGLLLRLGVGKDFHALLVGGGVLVNLNLDGMRGGHDKDLVPAAGMKTYGAGAVQYVDGPAGSDVQTGFAPHVVRQGEAAGRPRATIIPIPAFKVSFCMSLPI